MEALRYLDFDLQIERAGDAYSAQVVRSPAGEASGTFVLPFSADRLENLVLKMGPRRGSTRALAVTEEAAAKELGAGLFESVFAGNLLACLRTSLDQANAQEGVGLRLKLRLQAVPELANLPWEFLFDPILNRFLSQSTFTPLVRYVELPERIRPLAVSLPLRILVMVSSPQDPDYPQLDTVAERARLEKALEPLTTSGNVIVDWMDEGTLAGLQQRLRQGRYHVLHYIGHGGFDTRAGEGVLVLRDDQGRAQWADAQRLGPLLHDHRSLRLIVLNSCEGARNSPTDPFAGLAVSLVRQGIPAVVAMQFEITDRAAISFGSEFYAALVSGMPVDAAVAEARKAILAQASEIEWGTPVLYMRAPDGALFDLTQPARLEERQPPPPAPALQPLRLKLQPAGANGRFDFILENPNPGAVEATLRVRHDDACIVELAERALVPGGSSTRVPVIARPLSRRSWGRRLRRSFRVDVDDVAAEPPDGVAGEFDDTPSFGLPIAGGGLFALGGAVLAGYLLLAGGGATTVDGIVFASDRDGHEEIYVARADGTGLTKLTNGTRSSRLPAVSPDGRRIAFTSDRDGGMELFVMDADGANQRRIPTAEGEKLEPAFSSDGQRVAFEIRRGQNFDIYTVNLDGTGLANLTNSPTADTDPSWSPDGRFLAIGSDRDGNSEIYRINIDGSSPVRLTNHPAFDGEPVWSPDGKEIAFESNRDGNFEIYIMKADGTGLVRLTNDPADQYDPAWSADGKKLAFTTVQAGRAAINIVNRDGTGRREFDGSSYSNVKPAWIQLD